MTVTVTTSCKMSDYEASSTTSLAVSIASKSLTVETGKKFAANDTVQLIANAGQRLQTRLSGSVTSYDSGTGALVVNATGFVYPYAAAYASKAIGTGAWTFVTDPGLNLAASDPVRVYRIGGVSNFLVGTVTSYDNTTGDITLNITSTGGSGTYSDWLIVSDGTLANWLVAPQTGDTIDVLTDKTFDIDATPISWPAVIRALDRGTIRVRNASTTIPLVITFYLFGQEALRAEKLGTIDIEGGWIELGTGNGSAGQSFTPPSAVDFPTLIEVETGSGTGVFEPWHVVSSGGLDDFGHVYRYAATDFALGSPQGKTFLFDPAARTCTARNAITSGAKVRVPNIHITQFQHVTYLNADITAVATTATVNWPNVHASTGEAQIESERITWSAKTNNSLTIARAARGTTGAIHTKGKKLRTTPTTGTSGDHIVPRMDTNPSGAVSVKQCSFGYFYIRAENYRSAVFDHTGAACTVDIGNSPAGTSVSNSHATYSPWRGNLGRYSIFSVAGDVYLFDSCAFVDSSQTNQSNTCTQLQNCFNIARFENICQMVGKRNGSGAGYCFEVFQCGFKTGVTAKNLRAVGTRSRFYNMSGFVIENFKHSDRTDNVDTSTAAVDALLLENTQNVKVLNFTKDGASCRNQVISTNASCADIGIYSANYDLNNNGNCALVSAGTRVLMVNCTFGNARSVLDATSGNQVTGDTVEMRNVRMSSPATYATGQGVAYVGKGGVLDGVSSLSTYWLTAGAMVPNYYDNGPMFTLWDDNTAATGILCVGSFSGEIAKDMYDLTGAYLDYGGRLYMETAGDVAIIKSTEPVKSVTSFRNLAWRFEIAPGNFTVGAAGSGYTSGTEYSVTGGSGTGGIIRMGATTLTTAAVMVAGEGYLPGDVLTIATGGGQLTLTWLPTFEFRIANPGELAGASWQTMTTTNLTAAIAALTGYDSDVGFDFQVRVTQAGTPTGAFLVNIRIPTDNDTGYAVNDTTFNLQGPAASDVVELRLASDDSLIATWTGGGVKGFVGASYFKQSAYFIRKTSGGVEIMRTESTPIVLDIGSNGDINLFSGAEVNLANNTSVESILALVTARLDAAISTRGSASDATSIKATVEALPSAAQTADAVWDEVLTGATHNVPSSAGRRLRQLASSIVWEGTAQGPGTGTNRIVLDTGASATDGAYDPAIVSIVAGTGAGQSRIILQYKGSTRTAIVHRAWRTLPDATSEFIITAYADVTSVNEGEAQAGGANTITLNADASSIDGTYVGQLVFLVSGAGEDQCAVVTAYNGTTKVATIETGGGLGWRTLPDSTTAYVMMPTSPVLLAHDDPTATRVEEIHRIKGLEVGSPMTATPTSMDAGGIHLDLTGDGETSTTVTRNDGN